MVCIWGFNVILWSIVDIYIYIFFFNSFNHICILFFLYMYVCGCIYIYFFIKLFIDSCMFVLFTYLWFTEFWFVFKKDIQANVNAYIMCKKSYNFFVTYTFVRHLLSISFKYLVLVRYTILRLGDSCGCVCALLMNGLRRMMEFA